MTFIYFLLVILASLVIIDKFVYPLKRAELVGLYKIYLKGSGFDDGAQGWVYSRQARYASEISKMLGEAKPGSLTENVAITFAELVIDQPGVKESLETFGNIHPDQDMRCLVKSILNGPVETQVVFSDEKSGVEISKVIFSDEKCK